MLGAPFLLALDEPTAELDGDTAAKVGALILDRARDVIVVMTTHLAETLRPHAYQVLRVEGGGIAAVTP